MDLSEVEYRINNLENDINNIKHENREIIGFVIEILNALDSGDVLSQYISNMGCPSAIMNSIIANYEKFNYDIVSVLLESKYFRLPTFWSSDYSIFHDHKYFKHILKNPNLCGTDKDIIQKRQRKYIREIKKQDTLKGDTLADQN